jgi:transcription factor TFIIIB component B''
LTDPFALEFHHLDGITATTSAATVPGSSTSTDTTTHTPALPVPAATTTSTDIIVPYQHLGLLDPSWNIPLPNPQEKTLRHFCSQFKVPRQKKTGTTSQTTATTGSDATKGDAKNSRTPRRHGQVNRSNALVDTPDIGHMGGETNDKSEDIQRSGPLVEVINGEIVIKQSSLILGNRRPTTEEVDRELDENIVVEESTGITATYNSFTKRQKTQHWSVQDTRRFFSALRQCGTDFTTMETIFNAPGDADPVQVQYRTRKQLKSKYLIESRKHPQLIDMAMNPNVKTPVGT